MGEPELNELLPSHTDGPPFRVDDGGAVRVGKSRISLDVVVEQYENGMTPEDMVRAYDTLALADIHAVIAYYLRHSGAVHAYLKRRKAEAEDRRRASAHLAERAAGAPQRHGECGCSGWPVTQIGSAIDDILLVVEYVPEEEIRDQLVVYLPFCG